MLFLSFHFMARASVIITKYCSEIVTGSLIGMDFVCFCYLVIWDDDSNDNDENRRKKVALRDQLIEQPQMRVNDDRDIC